MCGISSRLVLQSMLALMGMLSKQLVYVHLGITLSVAILGKFCGYKLELATIIPGQ